MLELKQEIVSIAVLLIVCITLSISCLILWMVRCRRDQIRNREDKNDHQRELDNFEDHKRTKGRLTPGAGKKIHEGRKDTPKKAETDAEKGKKEEKKKKATGTVARTDETMQEFETRMKAESVEEEGRSKRLDTVSVTAGGSTDTLQRNDSKVNVFSAQKREEEMDLNPGLNGSINLETI